MSEKDICMKEKLENKIDDVLNYIINKPVEEITHEDYGILSSELRDIRFREGEAERSRKMAELMANAMAPSACALR